MMFILLTCSLSFFIGALIGKKLAAKGVKADINLEKYQGAILFLLVAFTLFVLISVAIDRLSLQQWTYSLIPSLLRLYFDEYLTDFIFSGGFLLLGFLIFLESTGWQFPHRRRQLIMAIAVIVFPLSILLHYSLPVTAILGEPKVQDGVVLQTTDHTCVPASIATLARLMNKYPNLSERDVTKLTQTNRFGTTTLSQLRAMRQLGLKPQYKSGITIDELAQRQQLAILHVYEPIGNRQIHHAVVFLSADTQQQLVTIANPLWGIQVKTYQEMKDYWRHGETTFAL